MPVEYLEVVREVQKLEEKHIEAEPSNIELTEQGRGLNVKYLIGCICALLTLVGTVLCLGKQIFAFKTEKKRYEQLIRDNQSSSGENPMPTERALIGTEGANTVSPKKVVSTDMPALNTQQSDEEEDDFNASVADERKSDMKIKISKQADNDDIMQIEDQSKNDMNKKGSVPTTTKAHDVSSIIDRFDSVDNGDRTLQQVHGMFDQGKQSSTPAMSRLRQGSQQTSDLRLEEDMDYDNKDIDQVRDHMLTKESSKHKRI